MDITKQNYDALRNELQVFKRKLESKCEALLILSKDLAQCRQERDQFKLMAEQVQTRYQSMKRQLAGVAPRSTSSLESSEYSDIKHQSLAHLLCEMRDVNKSLQFEVDDLKQKLNDANGDIRLLREQIARHRLGSVTEGMDTRFFTLHEREDLVKRLEDEKNKMAQMERDLQQILDEKEEMVNERDEYKRKYENLNKELNKLFGGQDNKILDIDALIAENKYLNERIKQVEDERIVALSAISKYKSLLEKRKSKGILKLGQNRNCGLVVSQKQVHELLASSNLANPTSQMMQDIHALASSLLECLNDKSTALSHQRKANKILGGRVEELEKKLKELEKVDLKSIAEKSMSLIRLKGECEVLSYTSSSLSNHCDSQGDGSFLITGQKDSRDDKIYNEDDDNFLNEEVIREKHLIGEDDGVTDAKSILNQLHDLLIWDNPRLSNLPNDLNSRRGEGENTPSLNNAFSIDNQFKESSTTTSLKPPS